MHFLNVRNRKVHHLVLEAFIQKRSKGYECNHKNLIKNDNRAENLEWITRKENVRHALINGHHTIGEKNGMAKLNINDVIKIKKMLKESKLFQRQIASKFNITREMISRIKRGLAWKSVEI